MRTKLIRIGNSRGIRIPKPLLDQAGLEGPVRIRAEKGRLVIVPDQAPRQGWEEAFASATSQAGEQALLGEISNDFDRHEWTW